jgi:nitronate monooxygenase
MNEGVARADAFARRLGLRVPVLMAPMAGVHAHALPLAVGRAGGMGALGVLLLEPVAIAKWVQDFRAAGGGALQLNTWVPDPLPVRDAAHEAQVRDFLAAHGPPVAPEAGDARPPDFDTQCQAMLDARPTCVSSVMGLFPPHWVRRFKDAGIWWFANISTVAEARAAAAAGPMSWSPRAPRPAGTAARFRQRTRATKPWACLRCCRKWPMPSVCPWSPPAASPTRAVSRLP